MKKDIHKKPYRVLTIDGGGILGFYEASVLLKLAKYFNNDFRDGDEPDIGKSFDLICGTSTGSILASGLAKGIPISEIIQLYHQNAKDIFPSPMPKTKIKFAWWTLMHLFQPSGNQNRLKKILLDSFGNTTFQQVWDDREIALCIPSVNAGTHKANVFKTPHKESLNRDDNLCLKDACLASSAAPIYFPVAEVDDPLHPTDGKLWHADGGLWANNPVMIGLTEALELSEPNQSIEIYSIGVPTISSADNNFLKNIYKGILGWKVGADVVQMSLFAQASGFNYMAGLMAKSLTDLGKEVNVYRLPEVHPGSSQLKAMGLDCNDENTFSTMTTLSNEVASMVKSEAAKGESLSVAYKTLFENMESLGGDK